MLLTVVVFIFCLSVYFYFHIHDYNLSEPEALFCQINLKYWQWAAMCLRRKIRALLSCLSSHWYLWNTHKEGYSPVIPKIYFVGLRSSLHDCSEVLSVFELWHSLMNSKKIFEKRFIHFFPLLSYPRHSSHMNVM